MMQYKSLTVLICSPVTEFKYGNGDKLYLSAILDLKDKSIVSFAIGCNNNNKLAFDTFDDAVRKYPDAKPLLRSDRGYQYHVKYLKQYLTHRNDAEHVPNRTMY